MIRNWPEHLMGFGEIMLLEVCPLQLASVNNESLFVNSSANYNSQDQMLLTEFTAHHGGFSLSRQGSIVTGI